MMDQQMLALVSQLAIFFPVFLIIFTFRGFARALMAKLMGDDTGQRYGFLTLNPLAHVNIIGLTIVVFVFFFIGGLLLGVLPRRTLLFLILMFGIQWTYEVPINDDNFKSYRLGGIMTSLSGSLANFLLAFTGLFLVKFIFVSSMPDYLMKTLFSFLNEIAQIGIWFGVLDLIPLPPFDGGRMLKYILPHSTHDFLEMLESYSLYIILALFVIPGISDVFLGALAHISAIIKLGMIKILFLG